MGLEGDQAVDDLHPGLLEGAGPADVGLLVEARLELDHRGDLLAGLGGADQGGHDGAVVAGPVEGLLDGQHVGVLGGQGHERLHRGREGLVRVVDQDVALGEHGEDVGAVGQGRRGHRCPGGGLQVGPVQLAQGPKAAQVDGDVEEVDVVLGHVDLGDQHVQQIGRDAGRHLEAHRLTESSPVQLELDRGQQVAGLVLLDREVGVAGEPEGVVLDDGHRREDGCPGGRR